MDSYLLDSRTLVLYNDNALKGIQSCPATLLSAFPLYHYIPTIYSPYLYPLGSFVPPSNRGTNMVMIIQLPSLVRRLTCQEDLNLEDPVHSGVEDAECFSRRKDYRFHPWGGLNLI